MNEQQLIRLSAESQALAGRVSALDLKLARLQGTTSALDLVVHCLVMTHPHLKAVKLAIEQNAPTLLNSSPETHPIGAAMRTVFGSVEASINRELARRESQKPAV